MRLLPIVIGLSLAAASYGDTITLKNGRLINGTYLGGTPRQIKIEVGDDIQTVDVSDIARIEFSGGGSASNSSRDIPRDDGRPTLRRADSGSGSSSGSASGSSSGSGTPSSRPVILQPDPNDTGSYSTDNSRPTLQRASSDSSSSSADPNRPTLRRASPNTSTSSSSPPTSGDDGRPVLHRAAPDASATTPAQSPAAAPAAPLQIPAQTEFVVRTIDAVDSQTAKEGDVFRAALDQPVVVGGQAVIQSGADAQVKLVQAQQSGKFTGKTELTLSLWSVTVDGKVVEINTQNITKASDSRGAQTAKVAGGGAAVGAVIGAIAGGGKGAAVGAGAGAAAGAGVEVATKGQRVKVASETLLTFVLERPVGDQQPGAAAVAEPGPATQPQPKVAEAAPAPAPQAPAPTPTIKVGQTQDEVVAALGQPDSVNAVGAKQVYVYQSKSLTITFLNGKVSKVE